MKRLTILFDASCPVCVRCRDWLATQHSFVPLEFLPCDSPEARRRYRAVPWLGAELVVVSDEGEVWVGAAAFVMSLWALHEWREWSYRLSHPMLAPLAERFFRTVSKQRRRLADFFPQHDCTSGTCQRTPRSAYR